MAKLIQERLNHAGLVHFSRAAEGAYTIRKTFVILPVRQTRAK